MTPDEARRRILEAMQRNAEAESERNKRRDGQRKLARSTSLIAAQATTGAMIPTDIHRDDLTFRLVPLPEYHRECRSMPCFTSREVALLRKQAEAMGSPLPLSIEMVRALCEVKRVWPEATIDEKLRDWPPLWQWEKLDA